MVPVWMISSDLYPRFQSHDIIQRQITKKRYKTELYLYWRTNGKSYVVYQTAPFSIFNDLKRPLPPVSRSRYSLTLNISETVQDTDIVSMEYTNRDLHTFYTTVSCRMTLRVLEWLSKMFNATKHRAASLRQQSYLSS